MDTEPNITDILSVIIAGIDKEKYYQVCLIYIYIGSNGIFNRFRCAWVILIAHRNQGKHSRKRTDSKGMMIQPIRTMNLPLICEDYIYVFLGYEKELMCRKQKSAEAKLKQNDPM